MADVKAVLTEALDGHYSVDVRVELHENTHVARHICYCGQSYRSLAEHLADAVLALPGVAVIQLPQRVADLSVEYDEEETVAAWEWGDDHWLAINRDGLVNGHHLWDDRRIEELPPLAAAILAAAAVLSEETTK